LNKPKDPAFDQWGASISTQVVQCLSIVTACFPYLKPFLLSLESGLMRADDLRRRGQTHGDTYNHDNINKSDSSGSKRSKVKKMLVNTFNSQSHSGTGHYKLSSIAPMSLDLQPVAATTVGVEARPWDGQSRESQTSQSRIIRETRSWNVDVENPVVRS